MSSRISRKHTRYFKIDGQISSISLVIYYIVIMVVSYTYRK